MRPIAVLFLATVLFTELFAAPANDQALPTAEAWARLVDTGKYADSWREASSYFRSRVPEKQWVSMVQGVRRPLGVLVSRRQQSVTFMKTLPGAPDGDYAVIRFQASFQNKASALETLTVMADGEKWRTAGYFIN